MLNAFKVKEFGLFLQSLEVENNICSCEVLRLRTTLQGDKCQISVFLDMIIPEFVRV